MTSARLLLASLLILPACAAGGESPPGGGGTPAPPPWTAGSGPSTGLEVCDNGIDDDHDALFDCRDPECSGRPQCVGSAPPPPVPPGAVPPPPGALPPDMSCATVSVPQDVDSNAPLEILLGTFDRYAYFLRPDAITHVVVVTDDDSGLGAVPSRTA